MPKPSTRRTGCLNAMGCLVWPTVIILAVGGIVGGIYWWHPWETKIEVIATDSDACPDGGKGEQTVEYLEILGIRVTESGRATLCVD